MPVKVAAVNLQVGTDVEANLDRIAARIAEAAANGAQLVVLPEFANHSSHWRDREHAWEVALAVPGPFADRVAAAAKAHGAYVMLNATVREGAASQKIFDANLLFGPDGALLGRTQKQVLMNNEVGWLEPGESESEIIETPIGRLGMYSCMDGLVPETTRVLALKGAQVLLNSLNSFARDEASLHIPVRAVENHVWVIAANKSGPLMPPELLTRTAESLGVAAEVLTGAGESQIVAPDGQVLAKAPPRVDAIAYAEIEPALADDKRRPSGDDLFADRRPAAYRIITQDRAAHGIGQPADHLQPVNVAAIQVDAAEGPAAALEQAVHLLRRAAAQGAKIAVLPELFPFTRSIQDPIRAAEHGRNAVLARLQPLAHELGTWLVLDLVEQAGDGIFHTSYLISDYGNLHGTYRQVHVAAADRGWAQPGAEFRVFDTQYGKVGLMSGYDGLFPESARVLTLMGADLILYPANWQVEWEPQLGIVERMTENHVSIVAANRLDAAVARGSIIMSLGTYPAPLADGYLNQNLVPQEAPPREAAVLVAQVHPNNSRNKQLRPKTSIIDNRRPELYGVITRRG